MSRIPYRDAIDRTKALRALAPFDPHVAGTPPLGLDLPSSDIDILCHAPDAATFRAALRDAFGGLTGFTMGDSPRWQAVVARFIAYGWHFEIFGQALPVARQQGWRHFRIEQRLLALGGTALAQQVMALRHQGLKTEPAFAAVLGLAGDPYAALLALEQLDDAALRARLPTR